jgi:hypothetical protein
LIFPVRPLLPKRSNNPPTEPFTACQGTKAVKAWRLPNE